jgi:hypothetical protein
MNGVLCHVFKVLAYNMFHQFKFLKFALISHISLRLQYSVIYLSLEIVLVCFIHLMMKNNVRYGSAYLEMEGLIR